MKNYKSSVSVIAICALLSVPAQAGLFDSGDEVYAEDIQPSSKVRIIDETKDAVQAESDSVVYIPPEKGIEVPAKTKATQDQMLFNRVDKVVSDTADLVDSSEKKVDLMAKEADKKASEIETLMKQKSQEELDMAAEVIEQAASEMEESTTFLTPSSQVSLGNDIKEAIAVDEIETKEAVFKTPRDRAEELKQELLQDLNQAKETRKELLGTTVVEREIPEAKIVKPEMEDEEASELAKNKVTPAVKATEQASSMEESAEKPLTAEERHSLEEADKSRALIARIIAEGKARKAKKREIEIAEREREAKKAIVQENKTTLLRAPRWSKTPSEEKAESLFSRLEELKHKPIEVKSPDVERVDKVMAESEKAIEDVEKDIQLTEPAKSVNVRDLYKVTKVQDRDMSLPDVSSDIAVSKSEKKAELNERHMQADDVQGQHDLADDSMILNTESFLLLPELAENVRQQPNKVVEARHEKTQASQSSDVMQKKKPVGGISGAIASMPENMTVNPDRTASLTPEYRYNQPKVAAEPREPMFSVGETTVAPEEISAIPVVREGVQVTTGAPLSITDKNTSAPTPVYTELPKMSDNLPLEPVYEAPSKPVVSSKVLMQQDNPAQSAVESRLNTIANERRVQEAARQYQQAQAYAQPQPQMQQIQQQPVYMQQPAPNVNRPRYYYIPTIQPQQQPTMTQAQYYQMPPVPMQPRFSQAVAQQQAAQLAALAQQQRQASRLSSFSQNTNATRASINVGSQLAPTQAVTATSARASSFNSMPDYRRPVRKRMSSDFVTRSSLSQLEKRKKKTAADLSAIDFNASRYPEYTSAVDDVSNSGVQPFSSQ